MDTNIVTNENVVELSIIQSIHEIRGYRVMLDFDLAKRYNVETRRLKEQVKRNIERFPDDFMFQLSKQEWDELIANCDNLPQNIKFSPITPLAFTQEGVAMLSGVLHSKKAIEANIDIMRAFVAMRQYFWGLAELKQDLENFMKKANLQFHDIYKILDVLVSNKEKLYKSRKQIGFKISK